jgi:hypothetical protein
VPQLGKKLITCIPGPMFIFHLSRSESSIERLRFSVHDILTCQGQDQCDYIDAGAENDQMHAQSKGKQLTCAQQRPQPQNGSRNHHCISVDTRVHAFRWQHALERRAWTFQTWISLCAWTYRRPLHAACSAWAARAATVLAVWYTFSARALSKRSTERDSR